MPKWGEDNVDMATGGNGESNATKRAKWTHNYFISRSLRDVGWMFKQLMDKVKEDTTKEQE